jgi:predicted nucleotidyltransferase component of viral defense system
MSKRDVSNLPHSVRQKLLNIARQTGDDVNRVNIRYVIERLLYRISASEHASSFVLKGAMLFSVWVPVPYRSTMDLDLLGQGDLSAEKLPDIFKALCRMNVPPDGVRFDAETVTVYDIRENQEYVGSRVKLIAYIDTARIVVQVDIGIGDSVVPRPTMVEYPALLDFPMPRIRAYPKEAVVAEKFHAMATLGMINSRMKDFYDIWVLASDFEFKGPILSKSIASTFKRRSTPLPSSEPVFFTTAFAGDPIKLLQWNSFVAKGAFAKVEKDLSVVMALLVRFLMSPVEALCKAIPFDKTWPPGGPWS